MQRFFLKLLWFLPLALLVATVNYLGDPANLYRQGDYEAGIVRYLLAGQNVAGVNNYNERLLQKYYAAGLQQRPQVLVLGSSRSMHIHRELFGQRTLYNAAVSSASVVDLLATYELFRQRDLLAPTVVIGLDPWTLNRSHGDARWRTLADAYQAVAARHQLGNSAPSADLLEELQHNRYLELFSPAYFQESYKVLKKRRKRGTLTYQPTPASVADTDVKRSDGSYAYGLAMRQRPQTDIDREAIEHASREPVRSLGGYSALDPDKQRGLEALLDELQQQGVKVALFLAPYHPEAYQRIVVSGKYPMVAASEAYFRDLARQRHLAVIGAFDPAACGLHNTDFLDALHPSEQGIDRIFGRYGDFVP